MNCTVFGLTSSIYQIPVFIFITVIQYIISKLPQTCLQPQIRVTGCIIGQKETAITITNKLFAITRRNKEMLIRRVSEIGIQISVIIAIVFAMIGRNAAWNNIVLVDN